MKTILQILAAAGGFRRDLYLRIENPIGLPRASTVA